jgi:hypothetical protein
MVLALCLTEPVLASFEAAADQVAAELVAVDVITTDSHHFLNDAYLLQVVDELHPWARRLVRCREWPMHTRRGREFAWLLGARTWPAIYVNGRLLFDHIPTADELYGGLALAAPSGWRRECVREARVRHERAYRDQGKNTEIPLPVFRAG